jgi:peptidoglycan/xylan/chitin deacetylase (PgdA/CDA1 family)
MKHPVSLLKRVALPLACSLLCLGLMTSCGKLKEFLPKQSPKLEVAKEEPLSAEEEKMQKILEDSKVFTPVVEVPPVPVAPPFELNKSAMVSVLLYHDFVERIPRNEMMVSMPVFRAQMQALKDANIPVIPMSDVLAWKKGEKNIPEEAVVITLDDGWLGVHELAFPILKEFGYPFTIYLYKKYVNSGGRSMTIAQINEMLKYGAELGSHSISHQPLDLSKKGKTDEVYQQWLNEEIVESKKWLEETFNVPCRTFAYPYGNKTEAIVEMTIKAGYEAAVTVNPQKMTWDTPNGKLPRFTQLGDKDVNFKLATSFRGNNDLSNSKFIQNDAVDEQGKKLVQLKPVPNETITDRLPLIEADISALGDIIPETIVLRLSGFGAVPVEYDPNKKIIRYRVVQRLRMKECTANLSFKRAADDKAEVLSWKFNVDQKAIYQPLTVFETPPVKAEAPVETPAARKGA